MDKKKQKLLIQIATFYLLLRACFSVIGTALYYFNVFYPSQISFLFNDNLFYNIHPLTSVVIASLFFLSVYLIKRHSNLGRGMAVLLLIIDLFSFPYGTVLVIPIIVFLLLPLDYWKNLPKKKSVFRITGMLIIGIGLIAFMFQTGLSLAIYEQTTMPPKSILPPEAKINFQEEGKGMVEVVVEMTGSPTYSTMQQQTIKPLVSELGGITVDSLQRVSNSMLVKIQANKIEQLAENPNIRRVSLNVRIGLTKIRYEPCINDAVSITKSDELYSINKTGKDIVVAVCDTGINEDLKIFEKNNKDIVIDKYELHGDYVHWHGTAVASCIASQDQKLKGLASDVKLLDVGVFKKDINGIQATTWDVLKAWNWVAKWKHGHEKKVVCTNSFGIPYDVTGCHGWRNPGTLCNALNNMVNRENIPMVVAVGNQHPDYGKHIHCPGTAQQALTVGAVDDQKQIAYFSCTGPTPDNRKKPDVVAPGKDINTFNAKGEKITVDGTSFSTPITASVVALIAENNTEYDATQYKYAVTNGAEDLGPTGFDYQYGHGLVDAEQALNMLGKQKPNQTWNFVYITVMFSGCIIVFIPEIKKEVIP